MFERLKRQNNPLPLCALAISSLIFPLQANAMHIMEGFLPPVWALSWWLLFIPFVAFSARKIKQIVTLDEGNTKVLLALSCAFIFTLSALKLPSVTGSCSHPTGVGLAIILFGFMVLPVLGGIALLFQALFLAHGGLTTLGANGMSMAVIGPIVGYVVWKLSQKANIRTDIAVFLCAFFADISTYMVTSVQLGLAFPDPTGGTLAAVIKFMSIFCITQVPIAIAEGLLTVLVYEQITKRRLFVLNKGSLSHE